MIALNQPAPNLQDAIYGAPGIDGSQQLSWTFLNSHRFQVENPTLIPNNSERIWRVDNRSMLNNNRWLLSSIGKTLSDGPHARFNIRWSKGPNIAANINIALHRRVVRRVFSIEDEDRTTFVQYLFILELV